MQLMRMSHNRMMTHPRIMYGLFAGILGGEGNMSLYDADDGIALW